MGYIGGDLLFVNFFGDWFGERGVRFGGCLFLGRLFLEMCIKFYKNLAKFLVDIIISIMYNNIQNETKRTMGAF